VYREMFYLKGSSRVDGQRVKVDARRSEAKRSVKLKKCKKHCTSLFVSTRVGSLSKLYLDRFMETSNSKAIKRWCTSLFVSARVGSL
jgi:hypothetical protein